MSGFLVAVEKPNLECYHGPITALSVCSQKVVCGCGNEISIFDLSTCKLETRKQVLVGASVHGIKRDVRDGEPQLLCVFGAKQARVVSLETDDHETQVHVLSDIMEVDDWIWDAHWLSDQPVNGGIALALAHNSVLRWDWKLGKLSSQRGCTEKCILYCAHFIGDTWDGLLLAAGTVFNQVVLWPVGVQSNELEKERQVSSSVDVIHTFSGHKGVIFSICYHSSLQRLCSVSDDRSIRMWQLTFPCGSGVTPSIQDWKSMKSDLILSLFGHSARVWDVVLMSQYFASVGEDATCYIWDYAGTIVHKFKGHKGRSIWSLAVSEDEKFVLTGGGDSSIRMWEIQQKTKQTSQRNISVPPSVCMFQGDFPRCVKLLNFDTVLIMMNSGSLYSYRISEQHTCLVESDSRFRSYSVVSPCVDQCTVALGSITGVVRILTLPDTETEEMMCMEKELFSGKVLSLTWLDSKRLIASGPNGECILLSVKVFDDVDTDERSGIIDIIQQLILPSSKHRWIASACLVPVSGPDVPPVLVCGDKDGSVHCYKLLDSNAEPGIQPSQSFHRVHGKAGVTFVTYREGFVYTAGRDGFYRQWEMKSGQLSQLHGNKIVKGFEWIDQLEWYNGDLLVYGFFSSQFVVWSVSYNQQMMSVQCGGGHRAWDCCHDNDLLRFVYIKSGQVYMVESGHQAKQTVVQPALHGRELCDVIFLQTQCDKKGNPVHVICTASEDTTINTGVFMYKDSFTSWRPIVTLKGHLSSVRALAVSPHRTMMQHFSEGIHNSSYSAKSNTEASAQQAQASSPGSVGQDHFILFSGGGRAEVRAWKLNITRSWDDTSLDRTHLQKEVNSSNPGARAHVSSFEERSESLQDEILSDPATNKCASIDKNSATSNQYKNCQVKDHVADVLKEEFPLPDQIQCRYEHLATHFLGESRHKRHYSTWKAHKLRLDPETRIMSLAVSSVADIWNGHNIATDADNKSDRVGERLTTDHAECLSNLHILSTAGSDGVLRVFGFDEVTRKFTTLQESSYHHGCILKVFHYKHHTSSHQRNDVCLFVLSASTDGNIVFWSVTSMVNNFISQVFNTLERTLVSPQETPASGEGPRESSTASAFEKENEKTDRNDDDDDEESDYTDFTKQTAVTETMGENEWKPLCAIKAHQSGVNSVHALQISDSHVMLASGGDDNAVTVQLLEISETEAKVVAKVTQTTAHAAQVTGIWLLSSNMVVSVSIDQRICVWDIKQTMDKQLKLQLLSCRYIHVADVSSMDVTLYKNCVYLCIGGEGLCLYSFNFKTSDNGER